MSFAYRNASKVHQACTNAVNATAQHIDPSELKRLGHLADLACHVSAIQGDDSNIAVSAEDFALINGYWPRMAVSWLPQDTEQAE